MNEEYCSHLTYKEKMIVERIRTLLVSIGNICEQEKNLIVILNALDLAKEMYLAQLERKDERQ